ncbi:DNA cytosine methyltransferase [Brucella pseudogrignonensis]|uniref:DNA cytosine methyltransferase n=1 Tax=Brucella pseudogrignonensis TaxID=419475 RepID=UPI000CFC7E20|nr:DNA cytosine methyltransferase [Brucella pseudogrignonensis]MQP38622.1 hypothetical protein [Ochrobactrum sp. MYb237]PQZ43240.1 hypothetical protein CQ059_04705 [Brucella pseudogrignonensis]PRA42987.1 hypothetical protein CQ063_01190 [Brucella pseudogrignonensis]PRA72545.1 hypothetical protein CQ055_04390 [Brucella pseudogrignonensis]
MQTSQPLIIDSFAGGGGASTGIEMALGRSPDIAINHNAAALALHEANCISLKDFQLTTRLSAAQTARHFPNQCRFHAAATVFDRQSPALLYPQIAKTSSPERKRHQLRNYAWRYPSRPRRR